MWTRIDNDPPESMAPEGYAPGVVWWVLLFCAGVAALGAWPVWG